MDITHRMVGTLGVAATLALIPLTGSADMIDQPFLITTTAQSPDGSTTFRDVVVIHGDATGGSVVATSTIDPLRLTRDRSCFAVVENIEHQESGARAPFSIGVALDDQHVVPVQMNATVAQPAAGAQVIQANGTTAGNIVTASTRTPLGIEIDARIVAQDGLLQSATFRQTMYATDPAQPMGVSACDIERLPSGTTTDQTKAPSPA
jgi:hypothetical protein